jgi:transcriptional regulator with XRE-family HTH domain
MDVQLPAGMSQRLVRHRLERNAATLRELAEEQRLSREQLDVLAEQAQECELRAMVSETPYAQAEHREAQGHATALAAHLRALGQSILDLEREQDVLLDRLSRAQT